MDRFFALVKNEYIKILKKTSTKIMLVLILVCALGVSVMAKMIASENYYEPYYADDHEESYRSSISWLNSTKPYGYEQDAELYQFMLDNGIGYEDWRSEVVFRLMDADPDEAELNEYLDILRADDWKKYCQLMLSRSADDGAKWEYAYRLENDIGFSEEFSQQNAVITKVSEAKTQLQYGDSEDEENKKKLEDQIILGVYQLDHGIYQNTADMTTLDAYSENGIGFWNVFLFTANLVSIAGLLMIVVAGGSVASEFNQGTIKFLLINPVKRWKILAAKYFTCITFGYIMIALLYVISIPAVGILHGFDGFFTPYLYVQDSTVHQMSSFLYTARNYLLNSLSVVIMSTLAFAISSLVRSSALAIGVSVFLMFAGETATMILSDLGQDWARYFVFANTNLASIAEGQVIFPGQTVMFALMVILAHMVVFLLTAWDGFTKRSV